MPLSVDGNVMTDARAIFDSLGQAKFQDYSSTIRNNRLTSARIPEVLQEKSIGTVDATSCISVCYLNSKHVVIHHHDIEERKLEKIAQVFSDYFPENEPVQVVLIGGCRTKSPTTHTYEHEYETLNIGTQKAFTSLISFWNTVKLNLELQGWVIGNDDSNASLCSDFLVNRKGKIFLLESTALAQQQPIPEIARRLAMIMSIYKTYAYVYDQSKKEAFDLEDTKYACQDLKAFSAKILAAPSDKEVIKIVNSTTPEIEPYYLPSNMRAMANYAQQEQDTDAKQIDVPSGPVIILQGEVGHLERRESV